MLLGLQNTFTSAPNSKRGQQSVNGVDILQVEVEIPRNKQSIPAPPNRCCCVSKSGAQVHLWSGLQVQPNRTEGPGRVIYQDTLRVSIDSSLEVIRGVH